MVLKHLTGKQSPHLIYVVFIFFSSFKWNLEDPSRGVLRKRCSETMQQIYRRTSMPKCGFNKIGKQLVNLLHIFRTLFRKTPLAGCFWNFKKEKRRGKNRVKQKIHWLQMLNTKQKMKFSIEDFFSKCDQIRSFL